jgi:hypothetical protein
VVFNREVRPESSERRTLAAGRVQLRSLAPMPRRRSGILTASRQWLLATGATAHSSVLLRMSLARASSETGSILEFNSSVPIPAKSRFPESRLFPRHRGGNSAGKGRRDSEMPGGVWCRPAGGPGRQWPRHLRVSEMNLA